MTQPSRSTGATSRPARPLPRILAAALVAAVVALPATAAAAAPLVVIDAGHGGRYNHARYGKLREKNVNLSLAIMVAQRLQAAGYRVALTRGTDTAVTYADISTWGYADETGLWAFRMDGRRYGDPPLDDLQARVNLANAAGADLFVSIHNNGARSRRANGTETWASPRDRLGIALGRIVQRADVQATGLRNRGAFQTDFYVLRWSNMPAVLVEGAFVSNPREARLLGSRSFRRRLASGIATGVARWFATAPFQPIQPRYTGPSAADIAIATSRDHWSTGAASVVLVSESDTVAPAAAPLARALRSPILLSGASGLSTATADEIARLRPASIVVVGSAAVVPESAVASATAAAGLTAAAVRRIAGPDPYTTSALLAEATGVDASGTVVVVSDRPGELLSAAAFSAVTTAPLLLVPSGGPVPTSAASFLAAHSAEITRTVVVGPESAIASATAGAWPNVERYAATDRFALNASLLDAAIPRAPATGYVVSPDVLGECLAALSGAAHTRGGAVLFNAGRVMSPFTRRWIVNARAKSADYVVVGGYDRQPVLVDWMIDKAHR